MSSAPGIAVCLTTRNRAPVLARTIDSILAQSVGDFELIISDDASDDSTAELCRAYAARDARIVYYRNPERLGMPGNLNSAIRNSTAPLIANLHDGDVYRPDLLQQWRSALERTPDAAFVFNQYVYLDGNGAVRDIQDQGFEPYIPRLGLTEAMLASLSSPVWGTVMARRDCYLAMGLFNPRFGFISDVEMWMRLNMHYAVAYVREPLIELAAREREHPFAQVNWALETTLVSIHESIINALYSGGPKQALQQAQQRLHRLRRRRWLHCVASCVRRRRWHRVIEAQDVFESSGDLVLKGIATLIGPGSAVIERVTRAARAPKDAHSPTVALR